MKSNPQVNFRDVLKKISDNRPFFVKYSNDGINILQDIPLIADGKVQKIIIIKCD